MQDIRVELSDQSSQHHRLRGQERQHLQPAQRRVAHPWRQFDRL